MINRTKFRVEVDKSRYGDNCLSEYSANGYIKELDHELLIWDLAIEAPAWHDLHCGSEYITIIINDIRYTKIRLRDFYGDVDNDSDYLYFPAVNILFSEKE
jgi:hypothetical protein